MNTEHAGAKNGGGHWGRRAEAKDLSDRARREADRLETKTRVEDVGDWDLESQYEDRFGGE